MERRFISQDYYILAVNDDGHMPVMRAKDCNAGLVIAGLLDLLGAGVITMEKKKKITVEGELPQDFAYLEPLYTYLQKKPRFVEKVMSDYIVTMSSRMKDLTVSIGEALDSQHKAEKDKGGLFGSVTLFIPDKTYKNNLINSFKAEVLQQGEISLADAALVSLLKETGNLNQYFSKYERDDLKTRLKDLKKEPQNKQISDMINYVDTVIAASMTALMVSTHS